ncbi:MAG TPA: hypothetical protein VFD94_06145, partial [Jatrophihabitans sp.]|nr:hypothetical protein [Jatrophihabitans sp.]
MTGAADPTRHDPLAGFLARLAGTGLSDPDDPAPGLPPWTAQLIDALYDGLPPAAAQDWAGRVHAELLRLAGRVPFSVLHDWHADTVGPLLDPVCGPSAGLHARARSGEPASAEDWLTALVPALRAVYHWAYDYAGGYAVNYANAEVYGLANDFGEEGTREYATYYAELATGANRTACADANAIAVGRALAECFAAADPAGYAETFPYAAVRAYAQAFAHTADSGDSAEPV